MDIIHVFAILITITALFSYINLRYVGLPVSIGVMVIALVTMGALGQIDYCLDRVEGQLCWFIIGLAFASGSS